MTSSPQTPASWSWLKRSVAVLVALVLAQGAAFAQDATIPDLGAPEPAATQPDPHAPAAGPTPSPAPPIAPQNAPRVPAPPGTAPVTPAAASSPAAVVRPSTAGSACAGVGRPAPLAHLPITAARLASNEPLTIVALGSSTTAGAYATSISATYPSRLGVELARRLPGKSVRVINKGVNGQDVIEEIARFERDVFRDEPQLVIWQLGTNALLRDLDFETFTGLAEIGMGVIRSHGIDLVLMDLQYSPRVNSDPDVGRMLQWFDRMAQRDSVPVFRRYELMRQWAERVGPSYPSLLIAPDGLHLNDDSYGCLAAALADALVDAAGPQKGKPARAPAAARR